MQFFKLKCWTLVILFYLCRKLIIFVFWAVGRTKHVIWRNQLELRKWEEDFLSSTFWHFIRTFIRCFCPKWLTVIHTFIHWCRWLPCKTSTSGAVWGSVSCPRTLWYADHMNRTNDFPMTRCWIYFWASAAFRDQAINGENNRQICW